MAHQRDKNWNLWKAPTVRFPPSLPMIFTLPNCLIDTNSRGAQLPNNIEGMRKIESYFTPHAEGGSTNSLRLRSQQSSGGNSVAAAGASSTPLSSSETRDLTSHSSAGASTSSQHPSNPPPHTERATSIAELRKSNENYRIGKEQAEHKVLRLETELKTSYERQRQLEERCSKLCNSLEDIHRVLAQQEGRRKRDHLAADCVRLGKISTMRSGQLPSFLALVPSLTVLRCTL
jgi:hypothetical protein